MTQSVIICQAPFGPMVMREGCRRAHGGLQGLWTVALPLDACKVLGNLDSLDIFVFFGGNSTFLWLSRGTCPPMVTDITFHDVCCNSCDGFR